MEIQYLTPSQCVKIAKLVYPEVDWKHIVSEDRWDGYDLVGDLINNGYSDYFQISFNGQYSYFDEGLNEYKIIGEEKLKIDKFIKQL